MTSIAKRLDTHFAACAAAAAGVAMLGTTENADAAVVYSGMQNIAIPNTFAGVYLNLATGISTTTGGANPQMDFNPYYGLGGMWLRTSLENNVVMSGGTAPPAGNTASLALGAAVNAGSLWSTTAYPGTTNLTAGGSHFIGIRFLHEGLGYQVYGWVRVFRGTGNNGSMITDWAYESAQGVGINVGDGIPAPGALALLAMGAVGLRGRRRVA